MSRIRTAIVVWLAVIGLTQAAIWTGATTSWLSTNAWDTANIPNGVGEYAAFGDSSEYNVNIGSAVVVGRPMGSSITVDGAGSYTFGGEGSLKIQRAATATFANDIYFSTTGDSVFNVPVTLARGVVGSVANRIRANSGCGDVIFNLPLSWSNASLQLYHDSSNGSMQINGGMTASINKDLWMWTSQPAGITVNSTISSSVPGTRIAIANGAGTVRFSNPNDVAADSSLDRVGINTGTLELGEDNQIATTVTLLANGGTLDLNGHSNSNTTTLALIATTAQKTLAIDFSDAAGETLYFSDCSAQSWTSGNLLDLIGFEFGVDELRFGTGANGLTPTQLGQIRIDGATVDNLWLDADGFLSTNAVAPVLATWTGSTNSWASTNAWDSVTVPGSVGDGVVFGDSGEYSVEIDDAVSLGRVAGTTFSVEGTGSYTFSGDGSLRIERGTANSFVNGDLYMTTSGDTIFNVPLAAARTEAGLSVIRIRTGVDAGDTTFNQPITWENTSLQIDNDSASATMAFNGAMTGSSENLQVWVYAPLEGGTISLNNVISATTNHIRISIADGDGTIRLANPSGVVVDSSLAFLSMLGGRVELGANDQIAADVVLYNNGGTLDLNGYSNSNADTLTLASISGDATLVVDFSDAVAESLCFADSSTNEWVSSDLLNLSGFVFDTDSIRFGTDENGLTETQLSQIQVNGETIVGLKLDSDGYLALPTVGTVGSQMVSGGTGLALTWENVDGVSYSVETNDDLVSGSWGVLQSNLTGVGSSLSYTGTVSAAQTFFRIIQE
ncbi:hypothetical protein [Tichowtungia aerotolerans]|uniref:Uncharacterized protein n=1 Tax=Tichowtungia aerotolerans TaxID=2697043 RepID=A0A6P1MB64_9BACT|nr:hypothetical protein [Tichowtungia aerotolerans]QHI69784.1 hypothetical protein GT409_10095 [Tichowtungia aerotolerans]